ncbi:tyrosine--tRNA ligase [Mycoplasma sp. SG1]|uniref:tyrosine--tRNA ligase n=1 Tax=Mycoplasma sp. SG1 TaxID=2810348 RepID=UPI002023E430|nr:tyrosine--tRNA ligase [Mycoplasma sp. SG1]URM52803.1 tyrosine--tRNA ligase [Mycoplasma sp. SG1]
MLNKDVEKFLNFNNISHISSKEKFLDALINKKSVYCGFDPTASSLHIGNYIQIIILKRLAQLGLKPIIILGGATGLIGDPSGKNKERELKPKEDIEKNLANIKKFILKVFPKAKIVNNLEFYKDLKFIDFLRNFGKQININSLLDKDFIKSRLMFGISYTEFSYIIMQAWDFYNLFQKYNCAVQIGGSDQWGNISLGIHVISKLVQNGDQALGLTFPLLVDENNQKLGKSENNVLLFDKEKFSAYDFYQYFLSLSDQSIIKLAKTASSDDYSIIEEEIKKHTGSPYNYSLHKYVAKNIISQTFSEKEYQKIVINSEFLFTNYLKGNFKEEDFKNLIGYIPTVYFSSYDISVSNLLSFVFKDELSKSKIKSLIIQKGIKINNKTVDNYNQILSSDFFHFKKYLLIKKNKQHYLAVYSKENKK